jgi:hypothetical protein
MASLVAKKDKPAGIRQSIPVAPATIAVPIKMTNAEPAHVWLKHMPDDREKEKRCIL